MKNDNKKGKVSDLSLADLQNIAKLAKLSLSGQEINKIQTQLNETLKYVEILDQLETTDLIPTSQVNGLINVFKDDSIKSSLFVKEALANSSSQFNNYFKTKAVIEKDNK